MYNEYLKEVILSRISRRISEISKRHGGELTNEDIKELKKQVEYYEDIEKWF